MGIFETAIFYTLIGAAVAFAAMLVERDRSPARRAATFALTLVFWPVFAPFLLSMRSRPPVQRPEGPLDRRIASTEADLIAAMQRIRGVAEAVLAPEIDRVRHLAIALHGMAKRLGEMDRLLETPEFSVSRAEALLAELEDKVKDRDDPRLSSVRSRLRNIERLRGMRAKAADDLERALYKMEEMSSQ